MSKPVALIVPAGHRMPSYIYIYIYICVYMYTHTMHSLSPPRVRMPECRGNTPPQSPLSVRSSREPQIVGARRRACRRRAARAQTRRPGSARCARYTLRERAIALLRRREFGAVWRDMLKLRGDTT